MTKDPQTVDQVQPEEFVLPAGETASLFPPVDDLVFKRDRELKGLAYRADIERWFTNGHSHNGGPPNVRKIDPEHEQE
jgi:hypothetical protein